MDSDDPEPDSITLHIFICVILIILSAFFCINSMLSWNNAATASIFCLSDRLGVEFILLVIESNNDTVTAQLGSALLKV